MFPISIIANRAFIFDVETVRRARENQVLGILSGTLAAAPSQSIFMGVPLQLSVEEVMFLVLHNKAYLVAENLVVKQLVESFDADDMETYLCELWSRYSQEFEEKKLKMEKLHAEKNLPASKGKQDFGFDDFKNSFFVEIKDSNKDFPRYSWLVDSLQRKPKIQHKLLTDFVKSWVVNDYNGTMHQNTSVNGTFDTFEYYKSRTRKYYDFAQVSKVLHQFRNSYTFFDKMHNTPNSQTYFVSPGMKFGGKFIVYPGDPLRYHSHHIVNFYEYTQAVDLLSIINGGRLAVGVKKVWVISGCKHDAHPVLSESDFEQEVEKLVDTTSEVAESPENELVSFSIEWAGFG